MASLELPQRHVAYEILDLHQTSLSSGRRTNFEITAHFCNHEIF